MIQKAGYCIICNKQYTHYGNNAMPVSEGLCCDKCNELVVIPARLQLLKEGLDKNGTM
jgi:hypothetical protein